MTLQVDGAHITLQGDPTKLDRSLPVLSLSTGEQIRFEDDPEEWARSLPTVLHAPDFEAAVVHDTDPPKTPVVERQSVAVDEIPAPHALH